MTTHSSTAGSSRRDFLKATTFAAAGAAILAGFPFVLRGATPDRKFKVGLIGAGWYGKSDLWRLLQVAPIEIIALCDPDKQMLAGAVEIAVQRQKSKQAPRTYGDYRQMLKENQLDIVLIGSPDHWHALQAIAAIESGAHVYLQ
jgi:predicted dehydrogenase